jgi:hypothetical protein
LRNRSSIARVRGGDTITAEGGIVVSDQDLPNPARKDLDEPHLPAEELEKEIGDSEPWDEASEGAGGAIPKDPRPGSREAKGHL